MKPYYSEPSLIYKGFNKYWNDNGAFAKYICYIENRRVNHYDIESNNRNRYNIKNNMPFCYYGKQPISIPRKFLFTLKRLNLLLFGEMYEIKFKASIEYARMCKKLCTDYYLPIFELGE